MIVARSASAQLSLQPSATGPGGNATPPAQAPAGQADQQIEAYPLTAESREVLIPWQRFATGRTDIRVAIDERTSQVLVWASAAMHAEIRQQLTAKTAATQVQNQTPGVGLSAPTSAVNLQLRNMPPTELHARLQRLLAGPLPVAVDASGEWQSFTVQASPGASVAMNVNTRTGQVRIDGPPLRVAAWRKVVEALDSPPAGPGNVTQLVSTKPANHERVRKTLQALQAGSQPPKGSPSLVSMLLQQQGNENANGALAQAGGATQAPPAGAQAPSASAQTAIDAARLAEAAGGLLGPVQVEFVEGLDVIMLRGSERDVQRVLEIINEIEELSAVTVPAIEIHELRFVDSVQLAVLLTRLYAQDGILGSRIGTLSITPLAKPNAVLIIGRQENVQTAIDLIEQLDQPVEPTSRFEVFPLQHASAPEVKTLVDTFLGQQEGEDRQQREEEEALVLAPRAVVVADARTNSLIVSASPRDLAEIAALIQRVDRPGATAELKVFTVINGDATALAEMLRTLFAVPEDGDGTGGGLGQGGPVRMQFSVDPRTNSIIAAGSREDLAVVEAILLRLDEGELRERTTTVVRLNNARAIDVATALQDWLQTERTAEEAVDLAISPFEQIEREVIIVPEAATNSLIVSATPRFYNQVIGVIRDLDERPPMVLIQVLIAEVRLSDTDEFGVELGLQDSILFDRSLLGELTTISTTTDTQSNGNVVTTTQDTIVNAPGVPGFNFNDGSQPLGNNLSNSALATASNVAAQGLSNFSVGRWNPGLGFSGFVFSASSDAVSVLLRALQEKRRLEVLSRPQLMALDNQPGEVQVGQNVPRIVATNIDPIAGTTNSITYERVA
jgi:type II secretory pathway component GspD/PulD (secretin)